MTTGASGTFAINGVNLNTQPSDHNWVDRQSLGFSGEARPIYPSVRQYEIVWNLMSMTDFEQLHSFFEYSQNSGTLIVDLPKYATTPYQLFSYTGCTMQEPTARKFFETFATEVSVLILKVKT